MIHKVSIRMLLKANYFIKGKVINKIGLKLKPSMVSLKNNKFQIIKIQTKIEKAF